MRLPRLVIATALTISLAAACSAPWTAPISFAIDGKAATLNAVLASSEGSAASERAAQLREFRARNGVPETSKREAAYVLGRLLQKNPTLQQQSVDSSVAPKAVEAVSLFEEASKLPALKDRALLHMSEVAGANNDDATLRKAYQSILESSKDPAVRTAAEYGLAQSFLRSDETERAISLFKQLRKEAPKSQFATGALYFLGDAAEKGKVPDARPGDVVEYYRAYLQASPDGRFASEIVRKLKYMAADQSSGMPPPYVPTAADHELFGQVAFESGNWQEALNEWDLAATQTKPILRTLCLAHQGKNKEAQASLLAALRADPSRNYAPTATLICGPLTRDEAKAFWKTILAVNPNNSFHAQWNIAIRSKPPESMYYYRELLLKNPTCEYAPEALWWMFWDGARDARQHPEKIPQLLAMADEGMKRYPTTKAGSRLAFWSGKLNEMIKRPEQARKSYQFAVTNFPSYYYGHRARARLVALSPANASKAKPGAAKPGDRGWSTNAGRAVAQLDWAFPLPQEIISGKEMEERYGATLATLTRLGQYDECLEILPKDAGPEFKSTLLARANQPLPAINAANRELEGAPSNGARWQMAYPLIYARDISENAHAKGVDPMLVHALIREESRYNPQALSRSKAIGLMQLLPGTAAGVAKRLGVPLSGNQDVFQPQINIKLGTDYLSYALRRFNGNALLAVASYNGGPNAVKGWMTNYQAQGRQDMDAFVEDIPFRETRDYVRKVFGSYWNYLAVYE